LLLACALMGVVNGITGWHVETFLFIIPVALWGLGAGIAAFVLPFFVAGAVATTAVDAVKTHRAKASFTPLPAPAPYVRNTCTGCGVGQPGAPLFCGYGNRHVFA
jgi:hypothetical protein